MHAEKEMKKYLIMRHDVEENVCEKIKGSV